MKDKYWERFSSMWPLSLIKLMSYNRYTTNIPTVLKVMSNYEKYTVKPPNSEHHK